MVKNNFDNLNNIRAINDDKKPRQIEIRNFNTSSANITCFFKNIKQHLIEEINKVDIIFGCVAWLTDYDILDILAKKQVNLIVNKEDFLRPDLNNNIISKQKYSNLKSSFTNHDLLPGFNCCSMLEIEPIRCCGYKGKNTNRPRMHNKFLVFCKFRKMTIEEYNIENHDNITTKEELENRINYKIIPLSVWTGSFNLTVNAQYSFENAVLIKDEKIAQAYFNEFQQILSISESLNWESEYVKPEYRFGT